MAWRGVYGECTGSVEVEGEGFGGGLRGGFVLMAGERWCMCCGGECCGEEEGYKCREEAWGMCH